jgi:hypothetical protein
MIYRRKEKIMNVYLGSFGGKESVASNFDIGEVDGEIIVAVYDTGDWEGSAFVVFEQGGKVYEVNGNHCSCYGLEGQWEPEEVAWKELLKRPVYTSSTGDYDDEVRKVLTDYYIDFSPFDLA